MKHYASPASSFARKIRVMLGDRPWCVGSVVSLADIAIACHLGFITLRAPHYFPPDKYPNLARLWKTMEARESLKKTAPPPG